MEQIVSQILNEKQLERFHRKNEMDLALSVAKLGRFRINLFRQRGTTGIAIRAVNTSVPSFEDLNLPPVIKKLAQERRGLIIVTGTTGSGKSTTLAAVIEEMNATRSCNILTVEDPIEYIYRDKKAIISQREVGGDTETFASALRHAFRQDPDVILIGEVRDLETMSIALTAADTGHLVLTTLHTLNVVETITRIVSFFPPHQHQQIRLLLAGTLKAIVCQRLLARSDMPGRVPALEIMVNSAAIRECIMSSGKDDRYSRTDGSGQRPVRYADVRPVDHEAVQAGDDLVRGSDEAGVQPGRLRPSPARYHRRGRSLGRRRQQERRRLAVSVFAAQSIRAPRGFREVLVFGQARISRSASCRYLTSTGRRTRLPVFISE